ncbi:hypothetical protein BpsM61_00034 [Bacillus phage vB_BpsM-61]|nr:hypothetical protein BpsM61_00034 [Bacillus phage vB_BpsM-61]
MKTYTYYSKGKKSILNVQCSENLKPSSKMVYNGVTHYLEKKNLVIQIGSIEIRWKR